MKPLTLPHIEFALQHIRDRLDPNQDLGANAIMIAFFDDEPDRVYYQTLTASLDLFTRNKNFVRLGASNEA